MKHQAFAIAVFPGQETTELVQAAQGRCAEPGGDVASGQRGNVKLGQAVDAGLHLLRTVMQDCIHDRHARRGVTQNVAFGDEGNDYKLVQVVLPV